MVIDLTRDDRDGDAERIAALQSNRAVRVEVVAQEGNGAGGMVAAAEGSDGGAALETVGVGAEEGVAPEKNGVGSGGEKEVASEGSGRRCPGDERRRS